jgi:hypothetical protein
VALANKKPILSCLTGPFCNISIEPQMHEANQQLPGESSSADYYTTSVLDRPYRFLFGGKNGKWSLYTRLVLILKKALNMRLPPLYGITMPLTIPDSLLIEALPPLLQDRFRFEIQEAEELGYHLVSVFRRTTIIGYYVGYGATMLSSDGTIILNIGWFRLARGSISKSHWTLGALTFLQDKTILLTARSGVTVGDDLISVRCKREQLPPSTPLARVLAHHSERLRTIPPGSIIKLAKENVLTFQLNVAQERFRERLKTRPFRKLSTQEVTHLKEIRLDVA